MNNNYSDELNELYKDKFEALKFVKENKKKLKQSIINEITLVGKCSLFILVYVICTFINPVLPSAITFMLSTTLILYVTSYIICYANLQKEINNQIKFVESCDFDIEKIAIKMKEYEKNKENVICKQNLKEKEVYNYLTIEEQFIAENIPMNSHENLSNDNSLKL